MANLKREIEEGMMEEVFTRWLQVKETKKGAFPGGPVVKNLPANVRDTGSIHVPLGNYTCAQLLKPAL